MFCGNCGKKIAVELNGCIFSVMTPDQIRNSEYLRMFQIARDQGCRFTFGSDAHDCRVQFALESSLIAANLLKLTEDQILYL